MISRCKAVQITAIISLMSCRPEISLGQGAEVVSDGQATVQQTHDETVPVVVFIPGILGSGLYKNGKTLWGDASIKPDDEDLAYQADVKLDTKILEDLAALQTPVAPIYGDTITRIRTYAGVRDSRAVEFPYDWRQSNEKSAGDLTQFICDLKNNLKGRPILFYAHSMGGLVLKNWFITQYSTANCPGTNQSVRSYLGGIEKIIFVATPHLGAPIAIEALASSYNAAGRNDGTFRQWVKTWIGKRISSSLNKFGGTFPSFYELLPASDRCSTHVAAEIEEVVTEDDGSEKHNFLEVKNIFSYQIWKNFGWPKNVFSTLNNGATRKAKFIENELQNRLDAAQTITCRTITYSWNGMADRVVRVFSDNKGRTPCKITVHQPKRTNEAPAIEVKEQDFCEGDGTVPRYSATENEVGRLVRVPGEHQALASLAVPEVEKALADVQRERRKKLNLAPQSPVVPVSPEVIAEESNPGRKAELEQAKAEAISANEQFVAKRKTSEQGGVSPELRIYLNGRRQKDTNDFKSNVTKIDAYLIATELSGLHGRNRLWALSNAADASWRIQDYRKARYLAILALETAELEEVKGFPDIRKLKGQAALTAARAALKLGDKDEARRLRERAIKFGNTKAKRLAI